MSDLPIKKKIYTIQLRVTEFEKNRIKMLADKYSDGNMTAWVVWGAMNAPRKIIIRKERK
jgi:hypothetical protein